MEIESCESPGPSVQFKFNIAKKKKSAENKKQDIAKYFTFYDDLELHILCVLDFFLNCRLIWNLLCFRSSKTRIRVAKRAEFVFTMLRCFIINNYINDTFYLQALFKIPNVA